MRSLSQREKALLRGLIYPVQFEKNPVNGLERVMDQVVSAKAMDAEAPDYLSAVEAALRSDERLAELLPQEHPESVIRAYLAEVHKRLSQ